MDGERNPDERPFDPEGIYDRGLPDTPLVHPKRPGRPKGSRDSKPRKLQYHTDPNQLTKAEEIYAKWLGEHSGGGRIRPEDETAMVASIFGEELATGTLQKIRRKSAFKKLEEETRLHAVEWRMTRARRRVAALVDKGVVVHHKALLVNEKALDGEDQQVALAAARSVAGLTVPLLDRASPRKTEQSVTATHIQITLAPEQARNLDAPVMVVEAEEVKQLAAVSE